MFAEPGPIAPLVAHDEHGDLDHLPHHGAEVGFPIVSAKFCTLAHIALFDKHLECLEKREIDATPGERLPETPPRREMALVLPSHKTTSYQGVSSRDRGERCLQSGHGHTLTYKISPLLSESQAGACAADGAGACAVGLGRHPHDARREAHRRVRAMRPEPSRRGT